MIAKGKIMLALFASATLFAGALSAGTLDNVKSAGQLKCGVSQGLPGFSNPDSNNEWTGLDVELCRAVAAAVLGDATKVEFVPLSAKARFTALASGEIDVLSRNTTWTLSRDAGLGIDFVGVNYYDGQGFMVPKDMNVSSAKELDGAAICTNTGTTTELNAADYFRSNNMTYRLVAFEKADDVVAAYNAGRCDVYTTDRSGLAAQRLKLNDPDGHTVLPEIISKEPLGPAVRQGDDEWGDVVRWTLNAMILGEELGLTSSNVKSMASSSKNPEVRRLLGVESDLHDKLGLSADWAVQILSQVGNYEESYERNVGPNTPLKLARGVNTLWTAGGLLYAPPAR